MELLLNESGMPVIFAILMGIAILAYVILDGYDLGCGLLTFFANDSEKHTIMKSIAPFWDANETWLVLGVGLLLVAFPNAHGVILSSLYLPVFFMLIGLILRGVAFDFRLKGDPDQNSLWEKVFGFGSLLTVMSQGYLLGSYILGFKFTTYSIFFSLLTGCFLSMGYILLGSCWLIMKTEGSLQKKSYSWALNSLWITGVGLAAISLFTPWFSPRIYEKWFQFPNIIYLSPLPILSLATFFFTHFKLLQLKKHGSKTCGSPFIGSVVLFLTAFLGLAYSFFPYLIPESMTIWQAASDIKSLQVILWGALAVLPFIFGYTIYVYRVFWGKVTEE